MNITETTTKMMMTMMMKGGGERIGQLYHRLCFTWLSCGRPSHNNGLGMGGEKRERERYEA